MALGQVGGQEVLKEIVGVDRQPLSHPLEDCINSIFKALTIMKETLPVIIFSTTLNTTLTIVIQVNIKKIVT